MSVSGVWLCWPLCRVCMCLGRPSVDCCLDLPVCVQVGGASGRDPLPRWLTFDPDLGMFSGVPLGSELGPHLVTVRAIGADGHSSARDRFMVDVLRERGGLGEADLRPQNRRRTPVQVRRVESRCSEKSPKARPGPSLVWHEIWWG